LFDFESKEKRHLSRRNTDVNGKSFKKMKIFFAGLKTTRQRAVSLPSCGTPHFRAGMKRNPVFQENKTSAGWFACAVNGAG
jgi:hypothetical protein